VGVCSNICAVARKNSCSRVVLQGCEKLRGSASCEVRFSTSLQPDKNLYVCVCVVCHRVQWTGDNATVAPASATDEWRPVIG